MKLRWMMIAVMLTVVASAPPKAAAGINEWCEGTWVSDDVFMPDDFDWGGWDDMTANDVYLRWAAAQYLGHEPGTWVNGYHVLGWVSAKNQLGVRDLWVTVVQDFDPNCAPLHGNLKLPGYVNDVNWVHHGGFVPAGHARGVWYPPHGYLVWSGAGTPTITPDLSVGRFEWQGGLNYEEVYHTREGMLPSMASNRPFHYNRDIDWDLLSFIEGNIACWAPWICQIFRCPPCDSGQRMLLAYSGTLNLVTSSKTPLEDFSNNPFWLGSTIEYVIFRPGDNKIFHTGTLASVLGVNFDDQWDHAIYPEVVWNDGTKQWIVTWEERKLMPPGDCLNPNCRGNYRYARTIDEDGNLGPVYPLGVCWRGDIPTVVGEDPTGAGSAADDLPGDEKPPGDRPPPQRNQKEYCYFVNAANDHYSDFGIPFADRNPMHYSLHDSYMFEVNSSAIPRWLESDGDDYVPNIYDQAYDTHPHVANIAVIDYWDTAAFGYPNASYLMFKSIQEQNPTRVQNEFFLIVDQPSDWFTPPTYPNQTGAQQFYHETAGTIDYTTGRRLPWALSSSILSFMALWTQYNVNTGNMDLKYGNYYFTTE